MCVLQLPLPAPVTMSCWPAAWKTSDQDLVFTGRDERSCSARRSCLQGRLALKRHFRHSQGTVLLCIYLQNLRRSPRAVPEAPPKLPSLSLPMWESISTIFSMLLGSMSGEVILFSTARQTPSEVWIPMAVEPS